MFSSRITTGLAALLVSGVAIAALAPLSPFQEPVQASPHHAKVVKGVGNWEGTISYWMPGVPDPMVNPCTETVFSIGEFWTVSHFKMEFEGSPFTGSATLGYDTKKDKFVGTWIDNSRTSITQMEGTWDEKKNAIVMHYDIFDVMTGADVKMRSETAHTEDAITMTHYRISDAGEALEMKIAMTRKKTVEAGADK